MKKIKQTWIKIKNLFETLLLFEIVTLIYPKNKGGNDMKKSKLSQEMSGDYWEGREKGKAHDESFTDVGHEYAPRFNDKTKTSNKNNDKSSNKRSFIEEIKDNSKPKKDLKNDIHNTLDNISKEKKIDKGSLKKELLEKIKQKEDYDWEAAYEAQRDEMAETCGMGYDYINDMSNLEHKKHVKNMTEKCEKRGLKPTEQNFEKIMHEEIEEKEKEDNRQSKIPQIALEAYKIKDLWRLDQHNSEIVDTAIDKYLATKGIKRIEKQHVAPIHVIYSDGTKGEMHRRDVWDKARKKLYLQTLKDSMFSKLDNNDKVEIERLKELRIKSENEEKKKLNKDKEWENEIIKSKDINKIEDFKKRNLIFDQLKREGKYQSNSSKYNQIRIIDKKNGNETYETENDVWKRHLKHYSLPNRTLRKVKSIFSKN